MEVIVKGQPSIEIGFETKVIQVGGLGDIDSSLSTESENPVMNKVVTEKLTELSQEVSGVLTEVESQNELIEDLQNTKIDKEADDYYPQLAVGLADNLSGVDVVDSEVNFRRSGGGAISDGVARIEAIKGNSVVWNQKYPDDWTYTMYGITSTSINGLISIEGTAETTITQLLPFTANELNHKYLFVLSGASSQMEGKFFSLHNRSTRSVISGGFAYFLYENTDTSKGRYFGISGLSVGDVVSEHNIRVEQYDLTQMFGAGNEPTTIEEFYQRIPQGIDINAYNEGEIIDMNVQSIESVGVNAWDEECEIGNISGTNGGNIASDTLLRSKNYIPIMPSIKYYSTINFGQGVFFYDDKKEFITRLYNLTSIPQNARYMRFVAPAAYGTTYNHDICINISDTSINGKYFPYIKRVEDLSIIRKYFPQGMKSAGTAHDEIRYNKGTQKWEYSKEKIKTLRLADLVWYYSSANGYFYSKNIDNLKSIGTNKINILCDVIVSCDWSNFVENYGGNKATMIAPYTVVNTTNSRVNILNTAYTDVSAFIAWLEEENATLYYESNDWEWEELDAEDQFRDLDYQVWNCGTEKAIAEGISAPLAADITYGFNAIGKIKELESLVAQLRAKVGI